MYRFLLLVQRENKDYMYLYVHIERLYVLICTYRKYENRGNICTYKFIYIRSLASMSIFVCVRVCMLLCMCILIHYQTCVCVCVCVWIRHQMFVV